MNEWFAASTPQYDTLFESGLALLIVRAVLGGQYCSEAIDYSGYRNLLGTTFLG
jgi:hypothetical protein